MLNTLLQSSNIDRNTMSETLRNETYLYASRISQGGAVRMSANMNPQEFEALKDGMTQEILSSSILEVLLTSPNISEEMKLKHLYNPIIPIEKRIVRRSVVNLSKQIIQACAGIRPGSSCTSGC